MPAEYTGSRAEGGLRMKTARIALVALLVGSLAGKASAAGNYEEASTGRRALYTAVAAVANVMPVVSAFYAPRCLPGYIVCKLTFAGVSLIAAADQLLMSGGGDRAQTQAILHRGFQGDWVLTPRHVAGDAQPQVLPDPPPPPSEGGGEWQPPPL
jgi:hypothetical protein